jgi:acyl-CoA thioesterase FadM
LAVTAHQTLVNIDSVTRKPVPVPDRYREKLGVG